MSVVRGQLLPVIDFRPIEQLTTDNGPRTCSVDLDKCLYVEYFTVTA